MHDLDLFLDKYFELEEENSLLCSRVAALESELFVFKSGIVDPEELKKLTSKEIDFLVARNKELNASLDQIKKKLNKSESERKLLLERINVEMGDYPVYRNDNSTRELHYLIEHFESSIKSVKPTQRQIAAAIAFIKAKYN